MQRNVIFDLDGTLINSAPSILKCLDIALCEKNITPIIPLSFEIIGPPLNETLRSLTGLKDEFLLSSLVELFKEKYDSFGYSQSIVYEGVSQMLVEMKDAGVMLYLATNKRIIPTNKILEFFNWKTFFKGIYAIDSGPIKFSSKSEMVSSLIWRENLSLQNTTYIGDIFADYAAAKKNRINFIFAEWGYEKKSAFEYPETAANAGQIMAKMFKS